MSSSSKLAALIVVALVLGALCLATLARADEANLAELVTGAQERAKQIEIHVEPTAPVDEARVRRAAEAANRNGRAALDAMLAKRARPAQATPVGEANDTADRRDAPRPSRPGRLVVALSSSMPETQLREYFRQLDRVPEAIVVLRGFVGGARTVQPTGQWIERVRRTRPDCVECAHYAVETVVDSLAYRNLKITRVPAFAYLPDVETLSHCDENDWGNAEVVFGAASVHAALEALARHEARIPKDLIQRLGGRP